MPIDEGLYELITSNPLTRTVESAKNMIRKVVETMNLSSYWKYKLKVSNPQIPLLHGLPKIQKERNKMRPITSNTFSKPFLMAAEQIKTYRGYRGL
jgi:hypothetical protein